MTTRHHIANWREYHTIVHAARDFPEDAHLASLVRQHEEASGNGDFVEMGLVTSEIFEYLRDERKVLEIDDKVFVEF